MSIVEVHPNVRRDAVRLFRATALLLSGAAVHLWLFPAADTGARPRLMNALTSAVRAVADESAVATSGDEASVVTSGMGSVTPRPAASRRLRSATDRVTVVVRTVHPVVAPTVIPARPVDPTSVLFTMIDPPEPASPPDHGSEDLAGAAHAGRTVVPAVADTSVATALGHRTTAPLPLPVGTAPRVLPSRPLNMPRSHPAEDSGRVEPASDERLVDRVLQQYREAYESLDVTAAQTIWPTVNARALGAAFRQLAGQRVTFDSCGVSVSGSGSQATARCRGQAEYVPKVGSRRAYTASGEWVFDLQKEDAVWRITNANASVK